VRESSAGPYGRILGALAATPFPSISYVEGTTSTNADAAALLGDDRFGGHTIVAEYQSRGAGRRGRTWEAAAGTSLLFSTILPAAVRTDRLWLVPFWVALAVRAALKESGIPAVLQWPNDILAKDRKIAGILCQSQVIGNLARVACGVGINVVRSGAKATPIEASAAFCEDFAPVERPALLEAILRNYAASLELLVDAERVTDLWEAGAGVPGRRYRIQLDGVNEAFDATAERLEIGGALRVRRDDGETQAIEMADARVLR
jgi:BirA family transcriptional regulator, biotin operon repressor / biotin---[acetyl-CoA-carboxylase] ligase